MNVFTQVFGVALNFLMIPFNPSAPPMPYIVSETTCRITNFKFGENEMKVSLAPRGYCPNCCPVKSRVDIRFVLYTKSSPDKGTIIAPSPTAARRAGIDPLAPTVIYIHGFTEPSPGKSGRGITHAYLSRKDNFNVILVDWSDLATFPWYLPAVRNVKIVAGKLRKFLEVFNDSGEIPLRNVHLIGFSLGSHIAGFAGKLLRRGLRIPRITALDPAFPEYSLNDDSRRLTRTDADYIDVIHTDAGVLGLPISVGHADFYPNGGRALQPGCQPSYLVQLRLVDQIFACSHVRAWRLYAESVMHPEAFPATKCQIWRGPNRKCNFTNDALMGYSNNNRSHGQFYLITGFKAPFAKTAHQQMTE
ncbi:pancreatic triacylglycerol lipase [Tribolium madens]|uniref:pancreatic triacylglycerol lipase n=1 Tax=Tribolium madens TaxID=41895 RepID=UPI001CF761F2|nr:pancreatic triacylglycerol lipase [Tribolium madens]